MYLFVHSLFYPLLVLFFTSYAFCQCPPDYLSRYYLEETGKPEIHYKDAKKYPGVTQYDFVLYSVNWPDRNNQWQHRLSVFIPDKNLHKEALLFINGGINQPIRENEKDPYESPLIPYFNAYYARKLHATIITFYDVPNQYIRLKDNIDRKEDDLIANAWRQFLTEPDQWIWPPHLAMAKSTSIAMDAIEKAAKPLKFQAPKGYILSGVSKRGWASWLTMLADHRVVGIIPAVNEILDVENTIQFIKKSFNFWPPAFNEYITAGIHNHLHDEKFHDLMQICDPYRYKNSPRYQPRFNLPKYIIRTSGDDFFTPDCQNSVDI
ncbi:MAG: PhoPQ-activated protein PqaA family protein, partial [Cellvibrionales bacterium]|nr:PhoPQ-activated protein PqaA family protein [Cellvibrionales bacterium]